MSELQKVRLRLQRERQDRTLARRGNFILVRDDDTEEERPFIVYESSPEQWEQWGCASYGERFEGIGQAIVNLLARYRRDC